jgi:glycosyltransferase involved in cell wall biosynthesis
MITGRDFVVLSDDWNGLPTSAIHLFRRLSRCNRVFWFNTIGRFPRLSQADAGKVLRTLGRWAQGCGPRKDVEPADTEDGVHVVSPIMVPWFKPLVRRFNRRSLLRKYEQLCDRHQITDPFVVTTFPYTVDFLRAVRGGLKVYYCVDDFLDYPGVNHADWAVMEAELLQTVDGLVVTSRDLARKQAPGCPLLYLPHGVDFDHFHEALVGSPPVPALEALPRPIVGFFGLISEWVDLGLVAYLSEEFPAASFVLLGRAEVDLSPLAHRPNVHALGLVPYPRLPGYARYFDVGLIPFVLNQLTRAVNPLKLLEYFALGLPVLSTRLPELADIEGPLRLAVTREEFRDGLGEILQGGPGLEPEEAIAASRASTWDNRVEQLSDFLEQLVPTQRRSGFPA